MQTNVLLFINAAISAPHDLLMRQKLRDEVIAFGILDKFADLRTTTDAEFQVESFLERMDADWEEVMKKTAGGTVNPLYLLFDFF